MARNEDDDRLELEQWANLRRHPPAGRLRVVIAERSRLVAEALMFTFDTDPRLDAIGYAEKLRPEGRELSLQVGELAAVDPDAEVRRAARELVRRWESGGGP